MSAAQKLRHLYEDFQGSQYLNSGTGNSESLGDELRAILPQIVALVEAAEGTDPNQRWLHRALAALDEALTPAGGNE